MSHVLVKFCGLTRVEDIESAHSLGVQWIGLVCVPRSKRFVDVQRAKILLRHIVKPACSVGLFQNQSADEIAAVLQHANFDLLQFHGAESAAFCAQFGKPYLKAIPMLDEPDLALEWKTYASAACLLLDAHSLQGSQHLGGTGKAFAWDAVKQFGDLPSAPALMLAGGLTPANVSSAILQLRPAAVDVSSGIESEPGIKSAEKMRAFIESVHAADHNLRQPSVTEAR